MTDAIAEPLPILLRTAGPGLIVALLLALAVAIGAARGLRLVHPLALFFGGLTAAAMAALGHQAMVLGASGAPLLGFMAILFAVILWVMIACAPSLLAADRAAAPGASLALLLVILALLAGQTLMAKAAIDHLLFLEALALAVIVGGVLSGQARTGADAAGLWQLLAAGFAGVFLAAGLALRGGEGFAVALALGFIVVGLLMRSGAAPFHGPFALLSTMGGAAFGPLAGWVLALSAAMLTPALLGATTAADLAPLAAIAIGLIASAGAVWAAFQAASAVDLRRFVAGITATQAGLVLIGFAVGGKDGVAAALSHAVAATVLIAGLHYGAACMAPRLGDAVPVTALDGLSRRRPLAAAALMICALSAVGAPLTAGFLSKWLLIQAALAAGWWWAAAAIVAASLAVIMPVGALIERLYFTPADPRAEAPQLSAVALAPVLIGVAVVTLLLGVNAADLVAWAAFAAERAL
jgi:formate hydrogenlyase subunit 3/multisubunit Na+/H+ antiporter MnhD subunit